MRRPADATGIAAAAAILRAGGLVAFPTETVYGLGAHALDTAAVRRIFAAKGRPAFNPLIVHVLDIDAARALVTTWSPVAQALAERFWPGPLTIVLPRRAIVPDVITGGGPTVAIRAPAHPVARALLAAFGSGIAAPSANRYGRVSPTRAAHVLEEFPKDLLVLEGGDCEVGLESTIVSLVDAVPRLLRPGSISRADLETVLGGPVEAGISADAPRVPGSTLQHYAPQTPLELVPAGALASVEAAATARGERVATLACPRDCDPAAYGRTLYAELRRLDKLGASRILVESVPESPQWDAVRDRLSRAAATFL